MRHGYSSLILVGLALTTMAPAVCQDLETDASFFVVDEYDPSRDPSNDLGTAIDRAKAERKHILLVVGGDWCIDCLVLDRFLARNVPVSRMLLESFLIVKINYSRENENESFLSSYPDIRWFPHIFVLSSDGALLNSTDTRELHEGRSLSESRIISFLREWSPDSGTRIEGF